MNNVIQAMLDRRSCRQYKQDPVPAEVLDEIIEAGLYAASGNGRQGAMILAVTDRKLRDRLSAMNAAVMNREGTDPFYGAPAVLVVLGNREVPTYLYDGSLVMGNLMLAASTLGIGNCWIHRAKQEFESEEGKQILKDLGIEGDWEGIGHCILGYPADGIELKAAERKEGRVVKAE